MQDNRTKAMILFYEQLLVCSLHLVIMLLAFLVILNALSSGNILIATLTAIGITIEHLAKTNIDDYIGKEIKSLTENNALQNTNVEIDLTDKKSSPLHIDETEFPHFKRQIVNVFEEFLKEHNIHVSYQNTCIITANQEIFYNDLYDMIGSAIDNFTSEYELTTPESTTPITNNIFENKIIPMLNKAFLKVLKKGNTTFKLDETELKHINRTIKTIFINWELISNEEGNV